MTSLTAMERIRITGTASSKVLMSVYIFLFQHCEQVRNVCISDPGELLLFSLVCPRQEVKQKQLCPLLIL